jgi:formylmethanofuran dehydrogenase subunit B
MGGVFCATCPVCGALCDDIEVTVQDNKIVKVKNACAISEAKFLNYHRDRLSGPMIRKGGELVQASWEEAINRSAEILAKASFTAGVRLAARQLRKDWNSPRKSEG